KFIDPKNGKDHVHKLEILGDGQQLAADSIHPDTGKPYTWHGGAPWDVPAEDLQPLTKEQARAWLDEATALLVARGWQHVGKSQSTDHGDIPDSGWPLIVRLAIPLWGEPTDNNQGQYRFGTHGSKHIDDGIGHAPRWYDFEANVGGNIDDLMRLVAAAGKSELIKP